jgi:hypothetical protein
MDNPAYIVYRISDGLVVYVCSWEYEVPEGYAVEYANWPRSIDADWIWKKTYRDAEGEYRITEELHPEEDSEICKS